MASAAALPAMSIPALAADPINAAIQRHRDAYRAHGEILEWRVCDQATAQAAADADCEARQALLEIQPTTIAGAAALLRYSWKFGEQTGEEGGGYELHQHLALALERMI
jgi:hypothetical protein